MPGQLRVALLFSLVVSFFSSARADSQADAKKIVDRAVEALGGKDVLAKFKAGTWKGKGKYYGLGQPVNYTGEWSVQPPEHARIVTEAEFNGQKFQRTVVINADKGWTKINDHTEDMDPDSLAEEKERLHANWAATVAPLLEKDFDLGTLGESKVGAQTALGIKASRPGHRDVKLFFDKETGLPIKMETRIKDLRSGQEGTQATFYTDYKPVDGVKRFTKVRVELDGKVMAEGEFFDFKPRVKLEESVFAKP